MTHRLRKAIAKRDALTLAEIYRQKTTNVQSIVNPDAERLVDVLFKQLKQVFPAASQTNLRSEADESAAKKQWIAAFAENGIYRREQLSAGMQHARASESPFWPSPGQFIAWCKQGASRLFGLPDDRELYDMVMKYSAERGYYQSADHYSGQSYSGQSYPWQSYPWQSNACWLMVTQLYSEMRGLNLTEAELRKRCTKALAAMTQRLEAGEDLPAPVAMITRLYTPVSNEQGLQYIATLRKKFNFSSGSSKR
ncbi:DNA replication protein [Serratia sp. S1B]|nr:DNA replication protein [Serratia sp. S1B]